MSTNRSGNLIASSLSKKRTSMGCRAENWTRACLTASQRTTNWAMPHPNKMLYKVCIHVMHCCEIPYNDNIKNLPHLSCTIFSKNIFGKRHYDIHFSVIFKYAWPLLKQTTKNKNVFFLIVTVLYFIYFNTVITLVLVAGFPWRLTESASIKSQSQAKLENLTAPHQL